MEGKIPEPVRVRPQKEDKRLLPLLNDGALRVLIGYRPKASVQWRVHARVHDPRHRRRIEELLTANVADFDFNNLLLTVVGKGRKQGKVPFSTELRKLFRFGKVKERDEVSSELMFPARDGNRWEHR